MNSVIKPVENSNYCLINDILKVSISSALLLARLKNIKSDNFFFDKDTNLWYYQNYKTKTKIFDFILTNQINKVQIINDDINDYRLENLKIIYEHWNLVPPNGYKILNEGIPTLIKDGVIANQKRNMYWKVENKNEIFYMMIIKENVYTKFSVKDLNKVLELNGSRPTWCLSSNGYISTRVKSFENGKFCYLHQLIMDQHTKDNTDYKNTVDHINQDKLDNRRENLRIVNMSEQNKNKGKQERRIDAKSDLPNGIKILPKYVEYRKEIYNKENNSSREFFIVSHPKLDKPWETTKSNKISIQDKFKHAKSKIDLIDNKISEDQFKQIIGFEDKIDLPLGIRLDIFREKYHYILDLKKDNERYNAKMILHSTDIQKELDTFIDTVVNIKYPNFLKKYKIKNLIDINDELISKQIEKEINIEKTPTYPKGFIVYKEKDSFYIQYSKTINGKRYGKKNKINSKDIQKELDKLIDDINTKYKDFNLSNIPNGIFPLQKQKVINPELFNP